MTPEDRQWLVGILEGEGSFMLSNTSSGTQRVEIRMIDKDIIDRAAKLMRSKLHPPRFSLGSRHPVYTSVVTGSKARWLMTQMLPYVGSRRRSQIECSLNYGPYGYKRRDRKRELSSLSKNTQDIE